MFSRLYWREIKLSDNAYEYKLNDFQLIPTVNCWRALVFYFILFTAMNISKRAFQMIQAHVYHYKSYICSKQ